MAASAGTVTLDLDANSVKLLRELQKSGKSARKTSRQMAKDFEVGFKRIAKATAIIGAASTAVLTKMTRDGLKAVDAQAKLAAQIGGTVDAVQALEMVFGDAGLSSSDMTRSLQRLNQSIGEAREGSGAAADALGKLRLNADDLMALDADRRIAAVADAISRFGDEADQANIAADLFGSRRGVQMLNVIQQGGEAFDKARADVDRFGLSISQIEAKQIEDANDAMGIFSDVAQGASNKLAALMAPALEDVAHWMEEITVEAGGVGTAVESSFNKSLVYIAAVADQAQRVNDILAHAWSGFQSMPAWAKEVGIAGALMGGKKGAAALIAVSKAAEETRTTAAWAAAALSGDISLGEWMFTGEDAARERLKELGHDLDEITQGGGPSLFDALTGGSNEDVETWGDNLLAYFDGLQAKLTEANQQISQSFNVDPASGAGTSSSGEDPFKLLAAMNRENQERMLDEEFEMAQRRERIKAENLAIIAELDAENNQRLVEQAVEMEAERVKQAREASEKMSAFATQAAHNMQDIFADFLFDPFKDGLDGMLKGFANVLRQMVAQAAASSILKTVFGGLAGSANPVLSSIGGAFESFDGGGFTGSGPRSGGVDGKGGFPAILHPNETVIDHSRGGGESPNVTVNIDARGADPGVESRLRDMATRQIIPQAIAGAVQAIRAESTRPEYS